MRLSGDKPGLKTKITLLITYRVPSLVHVFLVPVGATDLGHGSKGNPSWTSTGSRCGFRSVQARGGVGAASGGEGVAAVVGLSLLALASTVVGTLVHGGCRGPRGRVRLRNTEGVLSRISRNHDGCGI